ncbi:hypothetical protein AvCA_40990 [Azotobacter vinelandii CA]|uniref:Uncharacterized protein n=2 Tax=Azotobacter vinelandii TaxID=354 RepID=C1DEQ5_AZOVD|nr:hypothetical protein Avin_40990 [Azotobacter vinelandii DJ]AGK16064.1 hypothetical protein AvCA_40990 [Azotobacter vinelandii CA]AGK21787.1 hypothetical protein AvCA6_40990 [Azotobacter vinelandii CA6]
MQRRIFGSLPVGADSSATRAEGTANRLTGDPRCGSVGDESPLTQEHHLATPDVR